MGFGFLFRSCPPQLEATDDAGIRRDEGEYSGKRTMSGVVESQTAETPAVPGDAERSNILRTVMDAFWIADASGRFLEVNEALCRMSGYGREELLSMRVPDLEANETPEQIALHVREMIRHGSDRFETRYRRKDGQIVALDLSVNYVPEQGGRFYAFAQDITEQKRAQEALRESEERFERIFRLSPEAMSISRISDGVFLDVNEAFERTLGIPREKVVGRSSTELQLWHNPADRDRIVNAIKNEGGIHRSELYMRRPDGVLVTVLFSATLVDLRGEKVVLANAPDITARKQAEQAVAAILDATSTAVTGEAFFQSLVKQLASVLSTRYAAIARYIDADGARMQSMAAWTGTGFAPNAVYQVAGTPCEHVRRAGAGFYPQGVQRLFPEDPVLRELGAESFMGVALQDASGRQLGLLTILDVHPLPRNPLAESVLRIFSARAAAELERYRIEEELSRHRDHLEELVETRTRELQASREQARRAERLAAVGTLAAGIAHEINNPVGGILLAAEAMLAQENLSDNSAGTLRQIIQHADRCKRIVRNVRQFARTETMEKAPGDIIAVTRNAADLVRKHLEDHACRLEIAACENLPALTMNAVAMEQVLVNLLRNAGDAGARCVTLRIRMIDDAVELVVEDDGHGIPKDHLPSLFDPFFTTRLTAGGTGLGLSIAHGIITDHGGTIMVDSEPNHGTRFTVRIPLSRH